MCGVHAGYGFLRLVHGMEVCVVETASSKKYTAKSTRRANKVKKPMEAGEDARHGGIFRRQLIGGKEAVATTTTKKSLVGENQIE